MARQAPISTPVKAMTPPVPAAASRSRSPVDSSSDDDPSVAARNARRHTTITSVLAIGAAATARKRRFAWSTPVATVPPA